MSRLAQLAVLAVLLGCACKGKSGPCTTDAQCGKGTHCCDGACVDLNSSAANCGTCGNACGTANAAARCVASVCKLTCSSGFGDCNASAADGCETDLTSTAGHCGTCSHSCLAANTVSVCERSQCLPGTCASGFGDCNQQSKDGCEVELATAPANCGACGAACTIVHGTAACASSNCAVATCHAGFGDCNQVPDDGCETDLSSTTAHCSACGMACAAGLICKDSLCVAPELLFYGGLLNFSTSLPTGQVSSFNIQTHAWSAVSAGGTSPGPRYAHVAAWDAAGKQMLVWGGFNANNASSDTDLYALDFSSAPPTWKKLEVDPDAGVPQARGAMASAWDPVTRTLFLFGGGDASASVVYSDFWSFDVASLTWTQHTDPNGPDGRIFSSMVWDSVKQRVVVGLGLDVNSIGLPGFWAFDPASTDGGAWSVLAAPNEPSTRGGAVFLGNARPLLLWGGIDDFGDLLHDLVRLDDADGGDRWTPLVPATRPADRGYAPGTSSGERRFVFGGADLNFEPLSDTWELPAADAGWRRVADGGVPFVHPGTILATVVARQ